MMAALAPPDLADMRQLVGPHRARHELIDGASADCPAEPMDSEAPLFVLYTSGSTGKPKGVKHTTAGYNLFVKKTTEWVFDVRDEDVYWCTADIGWVTGHSYIVYGPLSAGVTTLMYEGAPNWPDEGRFWEIIEKYRVNIFYTAPTAIRAFIKWGDEWVEKHDLSSLRLLGTVGEGINPEAWMWYQEKIGGGRCPIVDTWWQTETGGIMMTPLPGVTPTKPGSCCKPLPGVVPEIVGKDRKPVAANQGGWLTIARPWPGMIRGIWDGSIWPSPSTLTTTSAPRSSARRIPLFVAPPTPRFCAWRTTTTRGSPTAAATSPESSGQASSTTTMSLTMEGTARITSATRRLTR